MAEILWPGYVWQKYIRRDRGMYGRGNGNSRGNVAAICVYAFLPSVGFAPFAKDHLNFPKHQCCYPSTIFTTVQWDHKWWSWLYFHQSKQEKTSLASFTNWIMFWLNHFVWIIVQVDWCWHQFNLLFDRMVWLAVRNGENRIIMKSSESPKDDVLLIL